MKITHVEVFRIRLPIRRAHGWASGGDSIIGNGYNIVRLKVENGLVGVGEAPTLSQWGGDWGTRYGEGSESTKLVIEKYLVPEILGEDVRQVENLHAKMNARIVGHPYAKAVIDQAAHDVIGKLYEIPVYQLLGGLVRKKVPICHSIGIMTLEKALTEAKQAIDEGVRTLKFKVGRDPKHDVKLVHAVRKAVGDDINIRVDANQGYKSWKQAVQTIKAMSEANLWFIEQPVQGLEQMARVAQNTDVSVMADESAWDIHDVRRIIQHQAAEMLSVYYTKPGGLQNARKVTALAEAGSLRCDVNGSGETGVGNAANLHLAASQVAIDLPCTLPVNSRAESRSTSVVNRFYDDDLITESFKYEDGCLIVPEAPGFGIELDDEKLAKYLLKD
jgi:muconate cycloisomerase